MTVASLATARGKIMVAVFAAIVAIALGDRGIGNRASLGILYMFPMVAAATVMRRSRIAALAVLCTGLRALFDLPAPPLEIFLRNLFALIAYAGSGLFVNALMREQGLRRTAEEQLEILVESSPAAIVTLDGEGVVLAGNKAADRLLMMPETQTLKGRSIAPYLPVLADALQFNDGSVALRTAAQCQGFRENGEIFLANLWFSSWHAGEGKRLAAIVVDSSEEMRDREEENLRQMLRANRIAAAAVSHEVRNLCSAISVVSANLGQNAGLSALNSLVEGLQKIASVELQSQSLEEVSLQSVLDDLRIVLEPQWREIGGSVRWTIPRALPMVIGERHGILQVFLNLAQNSHRAVTDCPRRTLSVGVVIDDKCALVRFADSGPGIAAPDKLFEPFQPGSDGTGLGLYVSRAVLRSYGGDLRWEATGAGTCFAVELRT